MEFNKKFGEWEKDGGIKDVFGISPNMALQYNRETNRYFTTLDGSADYYTIGTLTLTGDFILEVDFSTIATSDRVLIGNQTSSTNFFKIQNDATVKMRLNSATTRSWTTGTFLDGKLHTLKAVRVGSTIEVFLDGVSAGTQTDSGNIILSSIGYTNSIHYFDGVIANVKITDTSTSAIPIRNYSINEDLSTTSTIIDSGSDGSNGTAVSITSSELFTLVGADWESAELITNGGFATDSNWTKAAGCTISGGLYNTDGTTNGELGRQSTIGLVDGYSYARSFTLVVSSGNLGYKLGGSVATYKSSSGIYTDIITDASWLDNLQLLASSSGVGSFDNVSVKRILEAP